MAAAEARRTEDVEDIFHGALGWFGTFDVQHTVDPIDGVYAYERAWDPDLRTWRGASADADAETDTEAASNADVEAKAEADAAALPSEPSSSSARPSSSPAQPSSSPAQPSSSPTQPLSSPAQPLLSGPPVLKLTVAQLPDRTLVRLFAHFVWNAALVLASLVDHGCVAVRGRRVVELGAGTGVPSLVAALQGAEDVVATDYPAPAFLDNLAANVARNIADPAVRARVHVCGHAWGTDVADLLARGARPGRFDTVLLADVLWLELPHADLLRSCRALVKPRAEGGRIYLAFSKHTGGAVTDSFFARAAADGFRVRQVHEYRFATEWGAATRLDDYNESRRTVYTYEMTFVS